MVGGRGKGISALKLFLHLKHCLCTSANKITDHNGGFVQTYSEAWSTEPICYIPEQPQHTRLVLLSPCAGFKKADLDCGMEGIANIFR